MGEAKEKYDAVKDKPETMYAFAAKYPKLKFDNATWRPIKNSETMQQVFLREGSNNENLTVFVDNPPQWNPSKCHQYFFIMMLTLGCLNRDEYLCVRL